MTRNVLRTRYTDGDIDEMPASEGIGILDFIARDSPPAARETVDDLPARVEVLADHPRIGPIFSKESGPDLRRLIDG